MLGLSAGGDLRLDTPTIVDAARARPGRVFDGRSLLPLARRPRAFKNRDILIEIGPSDGKAPQYDAIRTPRYLYAEYVKTGERELYDLRRDRYEPRSRHASPRYAAVRRKLARPRRAPQLRGARVPQVSVGPGPAREGGARPP